MTDDSFMQSLKEAGDVKEPTSTIGLILPFTQTEIMDLIACAEERGFSDLAPMCREILLEEIHK